MRGHTIHKGIDVLLPPLKWGSIPAPGGTVRGCEQLATIMFTKVNSSAGSGSWPLISMGETETNIHFMRTANSALRRALAFNASKTELSSALASLIFAGSSFKSASDGEATKGAPMMFAKERTFGS